MLIVTFWCRRRDQNGGRHLVRGQLSCTTAARLQVLGLRQEHGAVYWDGAGEGQIRELRNRSLTKTLHFYYKRQHDIYSAPHCSNSTAEIHTLTLKVLTLILRFDFASCRAVLFHSFASSKKTLSWNSDQETGLQGKQQIPESLLLPALALSNKDLLVGI